MKIENKHYEGNNNKLNEISNKLEDYINEVVIEITHAHSDKEISYPTQAYLLMLASSTLEMRMILVKQKFTQQARIIMNEYYDTYGRKRKEVK